MEQFRYSNYVESSGVVSSTCLLVSVLHGVLPGMQRYNALAHEHYYFGDADQHFYAFAGKEWNETAKHAAGKTIFLIILKVWA